MLDILDKKWVFVPNLKFMQEKAYVLKLFGKIPLSLKLDDNKIELPSYR